MKKLFLWTGTLLAVATPILAVVSCEYLSGIQKVYKLGKVVDKEWAEANGYENKDGAILRADDNQNMSGHGYALYSIWTNATGDKVYVIEQSTAGATNNHYPAIVPATLA